MLVDHQGTTKRHAIFSPHTIALDLIALEYFVYVYSQMNFVFAILTSQFYYYYYYYLSNRNNEMANYFR